MKKILTLFCLCLGVALTASAQIVNYAPHITVRLNNKPIPHRTLNNIVLDPLIELFPGDTMQLVISTLDPENDSLTIDSNFPLMLPGATFNVNSARNPTAVFYWVPTVADISLQPRVFWVKVSDHFPQVRMSFINDYYIRVNKPGSIELNNGPVNLNQDIELEPGMAMNLKFSSVNPALPNAFTIASNVATILPGATFTTDNATQQTANINFNPTAAQVRNQPYAFTVTYQDNAPTPKQYTYFVNVKVRQAGMLGTRKFAAETIGFTAFPNPFSDKINFKVDEKITGGHIEIYNLLGQQIDVISPENLTSGQLVTWNKTERLAKGTYIARLISKDNRIQTLKFTKQ